MTELLAFSKISVGRRIALSKNVCEELHVDIGDKIMLIKTDNGQIMLRILAAFKRRPVYIDLLQWITRVMREPPT